MLKHFNLGRLKVLLEGSATKYMRYWWTHLRQAVNRLFFFILTHFGKLRAYCTNNAVMHCCNRSFLFKGLWALGPFAGGFLEQGRYDQQSPSRRTLAYYACLAGDDNVQGPRATQQLVSAKCKFYTEFVLQRKSESCELSGNSLEEFDFSCRV